jgi:hypothetical protein
MRVTMRAALTVLLGRATVAAAQDVAVQISDENEGHLRCEECQAIVQVVGPVNALAVVACEP